MRITAVLDSRKKLAIEGSAEPTPTSIGFVRRAGAFLLREFREILLPTIFFFIGFNLIVLPTNLLLANYAAQFASFMIAAASALIVAKALLVANAMPAIASLARNNVHARKVLLIRSFVRGGALGGPVKLFPGRNMIARRAITISLKNEAAT
jgi:hypothetical protein